MTQRPLVDRLFDRFYPKDLGYGDATIRFHRLCRENIDQDASILEIGAGPENETTQYLSTLGRVTGIDVSDEVLANKSLSSASVFDGQKIPFPDAAFDACVSNYVLE